MTATTVTDRIEKTVILKAPRSRIWRALSDATQFGEWFKVKLDGQFTAGATIHGTITYPGYEGLKLEMAIERIEPERLFSYRWHPGDPIGPGRGVLAPAQRVVERRGVLVLEPAHRHVPPGQHHRHRRGRRLPVDGRPDRLPVLVRPRHASSSRTAAMPRSTSSYDVDSGDRPTRRPPGSR